MSSIRMNDRSSPRCAGSFSDSSRRAFWKNKPTGPATRPIPPAAWTLFGILFVWQFPHFWAIAWLYREDYAQAGLIMLPNVDTEEGGLTGRMMLRKGQLLLAVSLLPTVAGLTSTLYLCGALVLGLGFLAFIFRFWQQPSRQRARHALWASLVYLPLVYLLLLADRTM